MFVIVGVIIKVLEVVLFIAGVDCWRHLVSPEEPRISIYRLDVISTPSFNCRYEHGIFLLAGSRTYTEKPLVRGLHRI